MRTIDVTPGRSGVRADYRTLREIVRQQLLEDILDARLKPGQRLIETELAKLYGVSRGPVREAILALEAEGFVRVTSNRSAAVASLTQQQIREVYEIRGELDTLAARFGTVAIMNHELEAMAQLLRRMDECARSSDTKAWLSYNDEFHMTLFRASGRERVCGLIGELMRTVHPYVKSFIDLPGRLTQTHAEHHELLAALEDRDSDRVAALTKEHLQHAAELLVGLGSSDHDTDAQLPGRRRE